MIVSSMFPAMTIALAMSLTAVAPATAQQTLTLEDSMKIRIARENGIMTAILEDNATSRDFLALLPLNLTLEDYASTEKISDLPKRLSTEGAPAGFDPSAGDITYYAPWGNLALFHKDFRYSTGLVKLGLVDSGGELLTRPGPLQVTITPAGDQ